MRPLRLDLAGFTVFREPTTIDFTEADFFALVGPTGSGKSTVLDAICFALYGTVPRWGDRRAIVNALAPSAVEGRVRLVFESGGARYVLTRVVRRDTRGGVTTRQAGLEALPADFDLTQFEFNAENLGEVLAGTAGEVDVAVAKVVGLPFEQFTKCVVLPQGEFAAFLHAKPAERQKILVNLLGLEVYGRVRERASALASEAEAQVRAADGVLAQYADANDESRRIAVERVAVVRTLAIEIDRVLPQLADAERAEAAARAALTALDAEVALLTAVRRPKAVDTLAATAASTRAAADAATAAVTRAEEREEKLRAELAAAGDPVALRLLLDAHAERARLAREAAALEATLTEARGEHEAAERAVAAARADASAASAAVEEAREAWRAAMATDRAMELRPHLTLGEPCPLCEQPVTTLPPVDVPAAAEAAKAAGEAAGRRAKAALTVVEQRDRALREFDRSLAAARAQARTLAERLSELDATVAGAPTPAQLKQELAGLDEQRRACDTAAGEVRTARAAARSAASAASSAEAALRTAWREFDGARDGLARFAPPAVDRDDLAAAWTALAGWVAGEVAARQTSLVAGAEEVSAASAEASAVRSRLETLFTDAGQAAPADQFARAAAVALERAEAALRRVEERIAEAAALRTAREGFERDAIVARTLAGHLRADRFERWLLAEALDALVDGASRILRELSGGQYDLGHAGGEFFVVDHHDAGLRRAVRTLSGGETFQASLALALALSEQLSGLSTSGASLESIVLDEGFGTLDAVTLDTVAATLENLAARGDRMVGVVTHVAALAERIPVRFEVTRDARTARVVRVSL
jgi:DNA repair protein SbcC/Rad50